jgi:putative addiction module component (TIGR02574 family)
MKTELKKIVDNALRLPAHERAALANILISSLDDVYQRDVEDAWTVELEKRIHDIRSGNVKGIPAEEVLAKIREKYH